jgi:hypothetical protein
MPFVPLGEMVRYPKKDNDGLKQLIGLEDGVFQGMVIFGSLGSLHPIKDKPSLSYRFFIQSLDSLSLNHRFLLVFFSPRQPLHRF